MKYFIAIEEDLLLKLWMHDPHLVAPLSRPFFSQQLKSLKTISRQSKLHGQAINYEVQALLPSPEGERGGQDVSQAEKLV